MFWSDWYLGGDDIFPGFWWPWLWLKRTGWPFCLIHLDWNMLAACRQSWGLPHVMGPCGSGCWHCDWVCAALFLGFASIGLEEGRCRAGFRHRVLILGYIWPCQAKFLKAVATWVLQLQSLLRAVSSAGSVCSGVSGSLSPESNWRKSYHVTLSFVKLVMQIIPELAHIWQVIFTGQWISGEKPLYFSAGRKLATSLNVFLQLGCSQALLLDALT